MSTSQIAPPTSYTFRALQIEQLTWVLTDENNAPVTGATVEASLYANRSLVDPVATPGTSIVGFLDLLLTETPAASGIYIVTIPPLALPDPAVTGYVLSVTATDAFNNDLGQWETRAVLLPPENSVDLVTVDVVKDWLGVPSTNADSDGMIQLLISSFSRFVLNYTGMTSFNSIQQYTEIYDGNGATRMFLRNYPVLSVSTVTIGAFQVPQSNGINVSGFYVEPSGKSIAFRSSSAGIYPQFSIYPYRFTSGQGNIQVVYSAGYSSVPFDLQEACMKQISIYYKRKDYQDLASKALSTGNGAGTITYRSWQLLPEVNAVLDFYSRYAHP